MDKEAHNSAPLDGVIVVDKPAGWTSHDVVNRLRRIAGTRKVGHLGTLDPLATGVLPLVVGRATRLAQFFTGNEKIYEAVIRFGWATDTYDREGEMVGPKTEPNISRNRLDIVLDRFRGTFSQVPPPVSAKKIGGVPAYKLARRQQPVNLAPINVIVHSLEVLDATADMVSLRVHCGAGTYLRSIAHDLGQILDCGAHLDSLRRTRSGDFDLEQARTLDELAALAGEGRLSEALAPAAGLFPQFSTQIVDEVTEGRIRQGRDFAVSPFRPNREARYVKAISHAGHLVAIGELKLANICHPVVVM
ncbi:MAG: tRNA pseudouridine(55) synthase TruB [Bryobacteraceae bacterium]